MTERMFCMMIDWADTSRWSSVVSSDSSDTRSCSTRSTTVRLMMISPPAVARAGLRNSVAARFSSPVSASRSSTRKRSAGVRRKTISLTFLKIASSAKSPLRIWFNS